MKRTICLVMVIALVLISGCGQVAGGGGGGGGGGGSSGGSGAFPSAVKLSLPSTLR